MFRPDIIPDDNSRSEENSVKRGNVHSNKMPMHGNIHVNVPNIKSEGQKPQTPISDINNSDTKKNNKDIYIRDPEKKAEGINRLNIIPDTPPVDMPVAQDIPQKTSSPTPGKDNIDILKETASNSVVLPFEKTTESSRPGDTGIGRPDIIPDTPPVDTTKIIAKTEINKQPQTFKQDAQDKLYYNKCNKLIVYINKILVGFLIFIAAVLGCFAITELTSFLAAVQTMAIYAKIPLIFAMGVFTIIILIVVVKIFVLMRKLYFSPKINIKELNERNNLQNISKKDPQIAKQKLRNLLNNEYKNIEHVLKNLSYNSDAINEIVKKRERLLNNDGRVSTKEWINDFDKSFLTKIDKIADDRIKNYALKTGMLGAISPFSIIDRFIMLSACLSLVKELMLIYAIRPTWHKSFILISWMVLNTYFAGIIQSGGVLLGDFSEDGIQNLLNNFVSQNEISDFISEDLITGSAEVAGLAVGKLSEAVVLSVIVRKLGKYVKKQLRPIEA